MADDFEKKAQELIELCNSPETEPPIDGMREILAKSDEVQKELFDLICGVCHRIHRELEKREKELRDEG